MKFDPKVIAALKRLGEQLEKSSGKPAGYQELIPEVALQPGRENARAFDDAIEYLTAGGGKDRPDPPRYLFRGDAEGKPILGKYDEHPFVGRYGHSTPHLYDAAGYGRPADGLSPSVVHQITPDRPDQVMYYRDFGIEREGQRLRNGLPGYNKYEVLDAIGEVPRPADMRRTGRTWNELLDQVHREMADPADPPSADYLLKRLRELTYEAPLTRHTSRTPFKSMIVEPRTRENDPRVARYVMEALPFQG